MSTRLSARATRSREPDNGPLCRTAASHVDVASPQDVRLSSLPTDRLTQSHRCQRSAYLPHDLAEQCLVVEFGLVSEDMRVGVIGHRQVALADELADPRPRCAAEVQQADPPEAQVVRRPQRDAGRPAGLRDRCPE